MRILLVSLTGLFISLTVAAEESPDYACAFEKPFIFGASISAGYSGVTDALGGFIAYSRGTPYTGAQYSPVTKITVGLHKSTAKITNIAEILNIMKHRGHGYRQIEEYIQSPKNFSNLRNSSLIASIDGLYWPAANGYCEEAIVHTRSLIKFAKLSLIPLVLATVPIEDPFKVKRHIRENWYPPQPHCAKKINRALRKHCSSNEECYLIPLDKVIKKLNTTGIVFEGKRNNHYDLRFDGIHLSQKGTRYVAELIKRALKKNPPSCAILDND